MTRPTAAAALARRDDTARDEGEAMAKLVVTECVSVDAVTESSGGEPFKNAGWTLGLDREVVEQ